MGDRDVNNRIRFTTRGRVVIPAAIRRKFGLKPGASAMITATPEGLLIRPAKRIKAAVVALTLTIGMLLPLQARLGETENELTLRYGAPENSEDLGHTQKRLSFKSKGCSITATILYGNCQHIVYRVPYAEVDTYKEALLQANSQGLVWTVPQSSTSTKGNRLLVRSDNQAYVMLPGDHASLFTFYTQKWADWTKKKEAESVQPKPRPNF